MAANAPKTSRQAKAEFKKRNSCASETERKRIERAAELERRAEAIKEREKRRRMAQKRREQHEEQESDARRKMGISLATQLVGFSHTQKRMKSAMESFLGVKTSKSTTRYQDRFKDGQEREGRTLEGTGANPITSKQDKEDFAYRVDDDTLLADLTEILEATDANGMDTACMADATQPRVTQHQAIEVQSVTVPMERLKTPPPSTDSSSKTIRSETSPLCDWDAFLSSSTQLTRELYALKTPPHTEYIARSTALAGIGNHKHNNPVNLSHSVPEGCGGANYDNVGIRDFAYINQTSQKDLDEYRVQISSSTTRDVTPCEHQRAQHETDQRSFTELGLSTQILEDVFQDDSTSNESSPVQPISASSLIPNPASSFHHSPRAIKEHHAPRSDQNSLYDLGFSTQLLSEAFAEDMARIDSSSSAFNDRELDSIPWTQFGV